MPILSEVGEPAVAVNPAAVVDTFFRDVTPLFSCELIAVLEKREPVIVPVLLIDSVEVICSKRSPPLIEVCPDTVSVL